MEKRYHIALDSYEQGIVMRCLNDKKNELLSQGKSVYAINDLIIKFGTAPQKKFKVVYDRDDAR